MLSAMPQCDMIPLPVGTAALQQPPAVLHPLPRQRSQRTHGVTALLANVSCPPLTCPIAPASARAGSRQSGAQPRKQERLCLGWVQGHAQIPRQSSELSQRLNGRPHHRKRLRRSRHPSPPLLRMNQARQPLVLLLRGVAHALLPRPSLCVTADVASIAGGARSRMASAKRLPCPLTPSSRRIWLAMLPLIQRRPPASTSCLLTARLALLIRRGRLVVG